MTPEFLKKNALRKLTSVNDILTTELSILEKSCHYFGMDEEGLQKVVQEVLDVFEKYRGSANKSGAAVVPGGDDGTFDIVENTG